ncbi:molybdenum cofactor guanylyltransferase [Jiangella asiatica]|uniref:Molybdenum cofactor guanylyltransferase n=1 Tax=Jiangella asiatica TaxID=2530372 RepID=A0A4R5D5S0_9ACTN|nr:NTP transferase domain-containing protein [Jiangella asiatica]TDE07897.1 molybdenum cofactor guanylyltransferase [Jiangella asiatica]
MTVWGAVVLAGGAGRRLGGADKPALVVGGRTLLNRAVAACAGATEVVVVGPRRTTEAAVRWTREDPPGGGPLAALAAGLDAFESPPPIVVVLAADLPRVSSALVRRLVAALDDTDAHPGAGGVAVVDDGGWVQPLVAAYKTEPLAAALDALGDPRDRPVRELLARLRLRTVVDAAGASDIDTPDDLARWQAGPVEDVGTAAEEG